MKKLSTLLVAVIAFASSFAQGSFDFSTALPQRTNAPGVAPVAGDPLLDFTDIKKFGLVGIGNLNTETFKELNSSGKLSGYIRPLRKAARFVTINFAFNVNASNSDSLMGLTFLFPDVGKTSFLVSTEYNFACGRSASEAHLLSGFAEVSTKNISATKDKQERFFNTISYVAGGRYQYYFRDGTDDISFTTALFFSLVNVPDEDNKDYRFLFTGDENSPLKSAISSIGAKFTLQVNRFQIFADLRHAFGNDQQIPIRDLKGFNSNIGVLFNASIFEK
jgi:hypothetical protein